MDMGKEGFLYEKFMFGNWERKYCFEFLGGMKRLRENIVEIRVLEYCF